MNDSISRQWLIECVNEGWIKFDTEKDENRFIHLVRDIAPSAQPEYQEALNWLLTYYTKSFELHGRYLPNEIIGWLIADFTKEFIAERKQDE